MMKKLVFLMVVMLSFGAVFAQSRVIVMMAEQYDNTDFLPSFTARCDGFFKQF